MEAVRPITVKVATAEVAMEVNRPEVMEATNNPAHTAEELTIPKGTANKADTEVVAADTEVVAADTTLVDTGVATMPMATVKIRVDTEVGLAEGEVAEEDAEAAVALEVARRVRSKKCH